MKKYIFKKVTIIGPGLLGGSIGMALKKRKLAGEVAGFFRNKHKISAAVKLGAVDSGTDNLKKAVENSDLVILCTPVSDILAKLKYNKRLLKNSPLITDIGSTKHQIVKAALGLNFIGSHPLAGSETSGINAAKADMFCGSTCIITPERGCNKKNLSKLLLFWKNLGAKTAVMSPKEHDRILSFTSHLPHVMAYSLINSIPRDMIKFSAGGLNDTTRIASSSPKLWTDILTTNKKDVARAIEKLQKNIKAIKLAISENNPGKLIKILESAQKKRNHLS